VKILHVIAWLAPRYGGPVVVVPELSAKLAEHGHNVEIVTTNVDGSDRLPVESGRSIAWAGATATFHPISAPRRYLTSRPMLADLWRRVSAFDVVHIHYLYRFHTVAAAAAARRAKVPYVIQAHGALDPWHRARRRRAKDVYHFLVEDRVIRGASAILCTSRQESDSIQNLGYTTPTFIIPLGIDADALREPGSVEFLAEAGINADALVVTFLGRISAKKGVDLLVESFVHTASAFPDAHLIIAGPDDEGIGRGLTPLIAKAGLTGRVSFIGVVAGPQKRALLQRSAVFVLPSADESFGLAVVEAMAVGCPVVVSPQVAIEDEVRASGAGIVVERIPADIARAVARVLENSAVARVMGEAGRRVVDEKFAWPTVVGQFETMYEAVIAAHRGGSGRLVVAAGSTSVTASPDGLRFVCPLCRGPLQSAADAYRCDPCGRTYPIVDGIPIFLPDDTPAEHDELDHLHPSHDYGAGGDAHKAAQAEHFDRAVAEEFEITRPHGTPRLYRFLLQEKFRRATAPIGPHLVGASALTVCGGSGMDAEFLARAGAVVTSSDISLGAARRTQERARRYGLDIAPIVADVERLPFTDGAFDLVLVHDGLHHLDQPQVGLAEMARVATQWVSITEPARAVATSIAVRAGVALDREESGNRVARLTPAEVAGVLRTAGFRPIVMERYAMYYRHEPGWVFRALSRSGIFPLVRAGWKAANALIGRFGNKMVVVAVRDAR
jgi:glycosyltransferase involved in cell wall biosynthesis/SAM-dependent methyltransferase/uncharacterized protein YbaR (Trm112 family)